MASKPPPTPEELILEMLRDVLARQARQMGLPQPPPAPLNEAPKPESRAPAPSVPKTPSSLPRPVEPAAQSLPEAQPARPRPAMPPVAAHAQAEDRLTPAEQRDLTEMAEIAAQPFAPVGLAKTLSWIAVALLIFIVLVNLPLLGGLAIVRATPQQQAVVLYEGLLIKGSGNAVYVIENGEKRLISSEDAFWHRGYRWNDVQVIDDDMLRSIPMGPAIHVVLKCPDSPNLYVLESSLKRFIQNWGAAEGLGYTEADIRTVTCAHLRSFSDGAQIP